MTNEFGSINTGGESMPGFRLAFGAKDFRMSQPYENYTRIYDGLAPHLALDLSAMLRFPVTSSRRELASYYWMQSLRLQDIHGWRLILRTFYKHEICQENGAEGQIEITRVKRIVLLRLFDAWTGKSRYATVVTT